LTRSDRPLILHVFSTFKTGGTQVRTIKLIEEIGRDSRHCIVAMDGQYDALELLKDKSLVDHMEHPNSDGGLFTRLNRYRYWIRSFNPQKVFTYNWGAAEIAMAAQFVPGIEHFHFEDGFGPDEAQKQLSRRVWFRRFALLRAKRIIVPSQTLKTIATTIWKFSERKVQLIENGIAAKKFDCDPDIGLLGLNKRDGDIWIGTVAGLRHEKRLDRLIDAFANLDLPENYHLLLIGTGYLFENLKQKIQELGLEKNVHFPGFVPEPYRYLKALDIFALSSDTEQFPISLVEAMAASRAALATDVGDIRAILPKAQHDFIFDKQDAEAFQQGLSALLKDPVLRLALGQANREKVTRCYTETRMFEAYQTIFS